MPARELTRPRRLASLVTMLGTVAVLALPSAKLAYAADLEVMIEDQPGIAQTDESPAEQEGLAEPVTQADAYGPGEEALPTEVTSPVGAEEGDAAVAVTDAPSGQEEESATVDGPSAVPDPQPLAAPDGEPAASDDAQVQPADIEPATDDGMNMYRLYNPNSGEHFYTSNLDEARSVAEAGWQWEGVGWVSPTEGDEVFRLYNPNEGDHHYTTSQAEKDQLVGLGWKYEGVGWYSGGLREVLREYNPNARSGAHNFTYDAKEHAALVAAGWADEGRAWYAFDQGPLSIQGFWLICPSWGSTQRYWVSADGPIAVERVVTPEEGAGYYAYATGDHGVILRGSADLGNGTVLLADNEGRMPTATGFVNSSDYGQGDQTYYLKKADQGYSAAQSGHVTVGSDHYWGQAKTGAILKGRTTVGNHLLMADASTGKLAWAEGWLVTDAYEGSTQRYYFDTASELGIQAIRLGLFVVDGRRYYGLEDRGFVARNKFRDSGRNYIFLADNEGVLENDGWVITDKYDGSTERYYVDPAAHAVITGHIIVDNLHYFSYDDKGFVVRGRQKMGNGLLFANNEGSIDWHEGWIITDAYSGNVERYYFDDSVGYGLRGAHIGVFSVDGKRYYGREDTGYVVRGVYVISRFYGDSANAYGDVWHDDEVAIADNEGVLMSREEFGREIVRIARTQIGASYSTEDNAYYPGVAFNCSGLSWWVYDQMGVHLPHNQGYYSYYANQTNTANSQMWSIEKRGGWKYSTSSMQAGDLVFFSPVNDKFHTGHVGVYIGNGQMIDCTPPGGCQIRNVSGTAGFVGGGFPITLV